MLKKTTLWSVVLLIGTLLSLADRAEGVVFGIRSPQKFCSSKLALQIEKWTLSDNDRRYSMKHAVPAYSVGGKHKTKSTGISQTLGGTAIYATEGVSGFVGTLLGQGIGMYVSLIIGYVLLPRLGFDILPESNEYRLYSYLFLSCPLSALGAAAATTCTGKVLGRKGSFTGSLIGSAVGIAAVTLPQYRHEHPEEHWNETLGSLFYPCASTGAVIGYNYKLLIADRKELLYCLIGCTVLNLTYILLVRPW